MKLSLMILTALFAAAAPETVNFDGGSWQSTGGLERDALDVPS